MRSARSLRGFLVHDARIDLDHLQPNSGGALTSAYTEAGPHPGDPVAADELGTYLVQAHSGQDADLTISVRRPGIPKLDGASIAYAEYAAAAAEYRGWNEPNLVLGYVPVEVSAAEDWTVVDACTIPRTQKVVVVAADTDGTLTEQASSWTWSPAARTWSTRQELSADITYSVVAVVCLDRTERVIAYQGDPAAGTVRAFFSDDSGGTWEQYDRNAGVIAGGIDSAVTQIAVIQDRYGALLMVAVDAGTGDWWLYRSDDDGATFTETDSGAGALRSVSLARLYDGRILMAYRSVLGLDPSVIIIEDAFDTIDGKVGVALDGTNNADQVECVVDADGIAYAVWTVESSDVVRAARSVDNGVTWVQYTSSVIQKGWVASPTTHRTRIRALASSGGELVALVTTTHSATGPTTDGSLLSLQLGGWCSHEARASGALRTGRRSFGDESVAYESSVFLPSETLLNQGWTETGTAETRLLGYHRFAPAAATSYAEASFTHFDGAATVLVEARLVSGGATGTLEAAIRHLRSDGANRTSVSIRLEAGAYEVWDDEAGAIIGSSVAAATSGLLQFLIAWDDLNTVAVYHRAVGDSVFTLGASKAALTQTAAATTTHVIRVGCQASTTSDVRVGLIAWGAHAMLVGLEDNSPHSLATRWGKALGSRPYPVRDQGASTSRVTHLSARGGAARFAETVDLFTAYDYGVAEILPQESPSASVPWRSTSTAEQIIAWDLGADSRLGQSWALAACLLRANFREAVLEGRTAGGGAWVEIATWDAIVATSVSFSRSGELLVPDASGASADRYWGAGQLDGGHVILDPAGSPVARRIRRQSAGGWAPSGLALQPGLLLDGIVGSEPTSGDCHIVAPSGVLVVPSLVTPVRYLRLRIAASQVVPDSYYELGGLVLGSLIATRRWSRGWSVRETPTVRVEEDETGTLWVEQRGPNYRELTVSWQDGTDRKRLARGPHVPYLSAADGAPALAAADDVRGPLSAMLRDSLGGSLPVVALAHVPASTGMVLDRDLFLAGVLTGRPQANNVQGVEGRDEVERYESITIREQP